MFMNSILPETLDPSVITLVNFLVGFHLLALLLWAIMCVRSTGKKDSAEAVRQFEEKLRKKKD